MELPRYHRLRAPYYRLEGRVCQACARRFFPPRIVCASCKSTDLLPFVFSGRGTLYSWSRVQQPARGCASMAPYPVGMVRLEEGPLVSSQLADAEGVELTIGMPVEMVTRKIRDDAEHGYIVYGYKFRPLLRETRTRP
jgi:scaffold protein (connect acetoacetyl-CoA thiolase and HMG-CoA synthase)